MMTALLVVATLVVIVVRPLYCNWQTYRRMRILRQQLLAFALMAGEICGVGILLNAFDPGMLASGAHPASVTGHLLHSPWVLLGAALMLGSFAQTFFPSTLMPLFLKKGNTDAMLNAMTDGAGRPETNPAATPMNPVPVTTPGPIAPPRELSREDLTFTYPIELRPGQRPGDSILKGSEVTSGCLHEAGHALLHLLRGDILISVWYRDEPHIDSRLRKPVLAAGATEWRTPDRSCACGGFVRNVSGDRLMSPEDRRMGRFRCLISLRPDCPECMRYAVTYLATIFAGAAATECYMPRFHSSDGSQCDDEALDRWFDDLPWLTPHRSDLIARARSLAAEVVRREQKAITALALLLAFEENPIDGHEAAQILRDNLVSESLVG